MTIEAISEKEYQELDNEFYPVDYISYDKKYQLLLTYAGEYRMGDTWLFGKIINTETKDVLWEYNKGFQIRKVSFYPWSSNSKSCYLTLIGQGNQIVRIDMSNRKLHYIFKSKNYENRLNWVIGIPQNISDAVMFSSKLFTNKYETGHIEYYCYLAESDETILINDYIQSKILTINENIIENTIIVVTDCEVLEFNLLNKKKRLLYKLNIEGIRLQEEIFSKYLKSKNILLLYFVGNEGWKYYKLVLKSCVEGSGR